jgi:hypothetical protein
MPVNPLCWDVLLLASNGDRYIVRHGLLSIAPQVLSAGRCPHFAGTHLAPTAAVAAADSAGMHWFGEFSMPKAQLAALVAGNCDAAALMRFARAPFAAPAERAWIMGDLRFDRGRTPGMFTLILPPPQQRPASCPHAAPWSMPRAELLR